MRNTLQRRVAALVTSWDDEHVDDPIEAWQEASELLAELPKSLTKERAELSRVMREARAVVDGTEGRVAPVKPSRAAAAKKMATKKQKPGPALMDLLVAGGDFRQLLVSHAKDSFFTSQVTRTLRALTLDDTGKAAKRDLRAWPRDVPFSKEHLTQWNAVALRAAFLAATTELTQFVSRRPIADFQTREELMTQLVRLAVNEDRVEVFESKSFKNALTGWTDQWAIFRLGEDFAHQARVAPPPFNARFAKVAQAFSTLAPKPKGAR